MNNSSRLKQTRATGSALENASPLIRRSYSFFLGVMVKKRIADDNGDDDELEPVTPVIGPCDRD